MAWQTGVSRVNYDYDSMGKITQTDYNNGSIVAFKVDSSDGSCPKGTNPPTFDNQNATGTLFIEDEETFPRYVYYSISFTGGIWKVSYRVNVSCSSDFFDYYEGNDGTSICITGYIDMSNKTTSGYSYQNSVDYCWERKSYPIGIWNSEEANHISNLVLSLRSSLDSIAKTNNTYIRIDGIRKANCQMTPETAECMSVEGFTFTGLPVENFDAYDWVTDSSAMETFDDNCIVMILNGTDPIKMDVRRFEVSKISEIQMDFSCFSTGSPLPPKMILCSSAAWIF
uniref:CW domain-containing protein n=1 Tax=Caenorhabditis tropicalis TaxID=1561998 RepID=A0A1I7T4Z1_9PELO